MSQPFPQLDDNEKKVLRVLVEAGMLRGRELLRAAAFAKPEDLQQVILSLADKSLVQTEGCVSSPAELAGAYISVRPSWAPTIRYMLGMRSAV